MEIIKTISVEPLFKNFKNKKAEIQNFLQQAQTNLGYFLVWFQSENPLALICITPKSHVCLSNHVLSCE
jgi:hypothetical protein